MKVCMRARACVYVWWENELVVESISSENVSKTFHSIVYYYWHGRCDSGMCFVYVFATERQNGIEISKFIFISSM